MKATGLFFLRTRAYTQRGADGALRVLLPVHERVKNAEGNWITENTLLATITGEQATAFWNRHFHELVAGRGLELELDRLRARPNGEWQALVTSATLAPLPPSWQKHAENNHQPPQALPA